MGVVTSPPQGAFQLHAHLPGDFRDHTLSRARGRGASQGWDSEIPPQTILKLSKHCSPYSLVVLFCLVYLLEFLQTDSCAVLLHFLLFHGYSRGQGPPGFWFGVP